MSLKNKLSKEMLKMSSAAAQQASTKAPSQKLSCWTQPKPNQPSPPKTENLNPTHGSTQPIDNSANDDVTNARDRPTADDVEIEETGVSLGRRSR